jgi:hypothetical protein
MDKTGWPRKSTNLWMKEISINMNPIPSIENKTIDWSKSGWDPLFFPKGGFDRWSVFSHRSKR